MQHFVVWISSVEFNKIIYIKFMEEEVKDPIDVEEVKDTIGAEESAA